jgi:hypothetical protein
MNTDHEVIDRNGRVLRRAKKDEVLKDGEGLRVPLRIMDAMSPGLSDAMALARAVSRSEQFDARGHRPGYATQDAGDAGVTAREARDARMRGAWRNPAPVIDAAKPQQHVALVPPNASHAELFKARDQAAEDRDRRLENAWKS